MIRKNPFGNTPTPSQNNSNTASSNYHQNNPPMNLPPKKNDFQNVSNQYQNQENSFTPPPPKASFSQTPTSPPPSFQNNQNNSHFFPNNNIDDNQNDEEYNNIINEFETKIKPLNCSSEYISTTTNIFPANIETLNQLSLPISISLCPMKNTGLEIPLVDYGENNIPRCPNRNCRAYLNPFVKFISGGEKWICNICGQINNTEDYYYSDVDKNGERLDINSKTELCCGTYEFVANKTYWKKGKNPTEALYIFLFETSLGAIDNGYFNACVESVKDVIVNESFYNGNHVKISIITYNLGVDFYSYNERYTQPQMLTVNESNDNDTFLPTNKSNLIFSLEKDKDKILQTLDLIQNTFNRNNANIVNNNCKDSVKVFAAIVGAYLIAQKLGGKILIFSSSNAFNSIPKMNCGIEKKCSLPWASFVYGRLVFGTFFIAVRKFLIRKLLFRFKVKRWTLVRQQWQTVNCGTRVARYATGKTET